MRIPACRAAVVALLTCLVASSADSADFAPRPRLPEFTAQDPAHWINSAPLSRDDLLGQVVLVDVWTFECWNCYRSFPWLRTLERGFAARGLHVIGIQRLGMESPPFLTVLVLLTGLTARAWWSERMMPWRWALAGATMLARSMPFSARPQSR